MSVRFWHRLDLQRRVGRPARPRGRRPGWAHRALVGASAVALGAAGLTAQAAPAAAEGAVAPTGGAWTVMGHGFGHGRGLSQWGAQSRALAGQSAEQILSAYYPGTSAGTAPPRALRVALTTWARPEVRVRSAGTEQLTISTSGQRVNPDQTLVLTRSGSAVVGTALGPDGAVAWSETWTTTPEVSGAGQFWLVDGSGNGTVYEGSVRFPVGTGNITPVDVVDLELYLRGVVPAESPSSWRPAALQAQAVAARSYVLSTLQANGWYDTCDTTACQVYRGFLAKRADGSTTWLHATSTNDAVAATTGQVRTYGGEVAFTQFSSSNGGWSAVGTKPYLSAAPDPYSLSTGSTAGDAVATWTAKLTVASASTRCPSGGTATALRVTSRDGNGDWGGRITGLELTCTTGTASLPAGSAQFDLRSRWWTPVASAGVIDTAWEQAGGATGVLGNPVGAETTTPDGRGSYRHYEGGSIYWTSSTGAQVVRGAIRARWASIGWERSALGYPTTDERGVPDDRGRYNHFQGGSIYWTSSTGAQVVKGAIRARWADLGWERSALGYPVTGEASTPDGRGRFNHFEGGSVYWTPGTGAQQVGGAIKGRWASMGWERSALGYPTTNETGTPDGRGRYNHFQGGSVYWTPATGAEAITGPTRDAWAAAGWEAGRLGYPTSSTRATADGAVTSFEHGTITYDARTRTTRTTLG